MFFYDNLIVYLNIYIHIINKILNRDKSLHKVDKNNGGPERNKSRNTNLSSYLKNHSIGSIEPNEIKYFKILFYNFYTPDTNEIKFDINTIDDVSIDISCCSYVFVLIGIL